jgi:hypothetical protein
VEAPRVGTLGTGALAGSATRPQRPCVGEEPASEKMLTVRLDMRSDSGYLTRNAQSSVSRLNEQGLEPEVVNSAVCGKLVQGILAVMPPDALSLVVG